jgi:hypothetical protein
MNGDGDRNPHHHIPPEFFRRAQLWMVSATSLVDDSTPFIYIAVENLMFAECSILQMERTLPCSP